MPIILLDAAVSCFIVAVSLWIGWRWTSDPQYVYEVVDAFDRDLVNGKDATYCTVEVDP